MGLKIWEFADTLQALHNTRDGATDPAVIAHIDNEIEKQLNQIEKKVDGIYEFRSRADSEMERLRVEEKALAARRKSLESRVEWIDGQVMAFLKRHGETEIKGEVHRLYIATNPPALQIVDAALIPAKYLTITPPKMEVNNTAVKSELLRDFDVPGAKITRGERIAGK